MNIYIYTFFSLLLLLFFSSSRAGWMYIIFSVVGRVSLCLDVVLSRFSFSLFFFLLFFFFSFSVFSFVVELSFSIIFFSSYCFLFSSLHLPLPLIIAIRQPSPNKRVHETRTILFSFLSLSLILGCYWCSITNFSRFFLHVRILLQFTSTPDQNRKG